MWLDNVRVNELLNKLLTTLLIVHLIPPKDRKFKQHREEMQSRSVKKGKALLSTTSSIPVEFMSLIN